MKKIFLLLITILPFTALAQTTEVQYASFLDDFQKYITQPNQPFNYSNDGILNTQSTTTKEVLDTICELYKNPPTITDDKTYTARFDTSTNYVYDASQSLFMKMLCSQGDDGDAADYLQITDYADYGLTCRPTPQKECQEQSINIMANIYHAIMGDVIDIMTAQVYGYRHTHADKTISEQATDRWANYGPGLITVCIDKTDSTCLIRTANTQLTQYLRSARSLVTNLSVLKTQDSSIQPVTNDASCITTQTPTTTYDIINCGLIGTTTQAATLQSMHNLLANELLRFTVAHTYYAQNINNINIGTDEFTKQQLTKQLMLQITQTTSATDRSMHYLSQIAETFSTHIHMVAYYELLRHMRNGLVDIYTPIHQLYFKLRNVQAQA